MICAPRPACNNCMIIIIHRNDTTQSTRLFLNGFRASRFDRYREDDRRNRRAAGIAIAALFDVLFASGGHNSDRHDDGFGDRKSLERYTIALYIICDRYGQLYGTWSSCTKPYAGRSETTRWRTTKTVNIIIYNIPSKAWIYLHEYWGIFHGKSVHISCTPYGHFRTTPAKFIQTGRRPFADNVGSKPLKLYSFIVVV